MALTLKSEYSILNDGTKIYVTDKTGAYNATTNPTGWGTPNYQLAQSCLLCVVIRQSSSGEQLFTGSSYYVYDNTLPNTEETEFVFTFALDGVLDICLVRLPVSTDHANYLDGGTAANGDYYLYAGTGDTPGIYYRIGGTYSLVPSTDYIEIPYENGTLSNIYTDITTPLLAIEAQTLYKSYRVEREKDCDDAEPLFQEILKLHEDIRGAYYTFWSDLTAEAQNQVESLLDKYKIAGN